MIYCCDVPGVKASVFGSFVHVARATCTGLGPELPWAARCASGGLLGPRGSLLSEDCCCVSVSLWGNARLNFSGFGSCLDAFAFLLGEYLYPLCLEGFVGAELLHSKIVIVKRAPCTAAEGM